MGEDPASDVNDREIKSGAKIGSLGNRDGKVQDMLRQLGDSDLMVTPVAMGCWPIAGMTSLDVNIEDSLKTLATALDEGINFFDTAYCYGADGISERLLGQAVAHCRDEVVIATKCGVHWDKNLNSVLDSSPDRILAECDESLVRLDMNHIDLMYLHRPDPNTPITESAAALGSLKKQGKVRYVAVSNVTFEQMIEFNNVCSVVAVQLPFNLFQQQIKDVFGPWCQQNKVSIVSYWPLMKGLLAGKIRRGHVFDPQDKRLTYEIFQGHYFDRAQDVIDELESLADDLGLTIAQMIVAWNFHQPFIHSTLCGAKRDWQIKETAQAISVRLSDATIERIDQLAKQFAEST